MQSLSRLVLGAAIGWGGVHNNSMYSTRMQELAPKLWTEQVPVAWHKGPAGISEGTKNAKTHYCIITAMPCAITHMY